ncbi:hypothetical protein [Klebsiella phage KP32]|uniref:Uncharacterized protein 12 n=1 Tax=Klebsiella phage KP32 TaxID=674082 RepID=D1L2U5_BPK32|nr:hypothetical protein KP-KP32_gp12 [Klebsiella phage KP32]ACY66674.1 hypothetical protein [Klebsiella phage KP32]
MMNLLWFITERGTACVPIVCPNNYRSNPKLVSGRTRVTWPNSSYSASATSRASSRDPACTGSSYDALAVSTVTTNFCIFSLLPHVIQGDVRRVERLLVHRSTPVTWRHSIDPCAWCTAPDRKWPSPCLSLRWPARTSYQHEGGT